MGTKWILTPTFTPLNISGRELWLDPTANTTINGGATPPAGLTTWRSKSILAPQFTASGSMPWGYTTKNGNSTVETNSQSLFGSITGLSSWSLFMVFNAREIQDQAVLLGGAEADPTIKFIDDSGKFALRIELDLVPQLTSNTFFDNDVWYQVCITYSHGGLCTIYVNGSADTSDSVGALDLPTDIIFLADSNGTWPVVNGYLCDVILYNSAFSSGQVKLMSNYLKRKWAL